MSQDDSSLGHLYYQFCAKLLGVLYAKLIRFILKVVVFDGGEYVSMAGEFNEFRKVQYSAVNMLTCIHI